MNESKKPPLGRPHGSKRPGKNTYRLTVNIPQDLFQSLSTLAAADMRPVASFVRKSLQSLVKQELS